MRLVTRRPVRAAATALAMVALASSWSLLPTAGAETGPVNEPCPPGVCSRTPADVYDWNSLSQHDRDTAVACFRSKDGWCFSRSSRLTDRGWASATVTSYYGDPQEGPWQYGCAAEGTKFVYGSEMKAHPTDWHLAYMGLLPMVAAGPAANGMGLEILGSIGWSSAGPGEDVVLQEHEGTVIHGHKARLILRPQRLHITGAAWVTIRGSTLTGDEDYWSTIIPEAELDTAFTIRNGIAEVASTSPILFDGGVLSLQEWQEHCP